MRGGAGRYDGKGVVERIIRENLRSRGLKAYVEESDEMGKSERRLGRGEEEQ